MIKEGVQAAGANVSRDAAQRRKKRRSKAALSIPLTALSCQYTPSSFLYNPTFGRYLLNNVKSTLQPRARK